jgi:hypothetical protein
MNYSFRKGCTAEQTFVCSLTTAGTLVINGTLTGTNLFADGTPVRIQWLDISDNRRRGLFGIYDSATETVTYDTRVYTGAAVSFADGGTIQGFDGSDIMPVDTYTLQSEIAVATYSNAHLPYYSNVDYGIKIPRIQGQRADAMQLLHHADLTNVNDCFTVFVDKCDNYAYSVIATTDTLDSINNNFARSLEFKVAKR